MKPSEDDPINLSNRLLHSLLEQIPHVQNFKGKWASSRTKLSDLQTQLADFNDFPCSTSHPLCLDLLHSISHTLNDAVSLAEKCQSANLTEGKLKTQSDIDSVLARLDRHIKDSEILIKSGVLQDCVVSSSSKREAVRVETRNFLTRLQIGSTEAKNSAMDALLGLLLEDDKNVMIAVAQGVVPVLVRLLDSSSLEMKEKTVAAISRVSMVDSSKHVLVAEGLLLLNHLLRILESGSGFAKEKACIVLQALSVSKDNARAIGSRGGISSLLEICQAGTPGSQAFAAGVLRNLSVFSEISDNFIEEKAIFVLIGLAASGTAVAQENAIGCLCNLVSEDESLKLLLAKEGVIECLKNYWDSVPSVKNLEAAVELLSHLASYNPVAEVLVSDGFIARLVALLNCGILGVRIAAARAVYELGFSTKTRKEMGECGCIAPLIKMLDGKAVEEKEAAAKTLSSLVLYAGNRRIFRREERGIVTAVQLLDPLILNLDKKYPISVLSSLVHSKKCRKQMVAAGATVYLQKLVEMDIEGAKKLLEILGRSKIWGIFSRP
ncbi:ARM repeat superfamily protein isoform 1 [Tripterygium wilfordii]|uniref:ARM repeat superfamily protein isoform 1 n=1 Tax=Tripterygium wilfordii TaxID=458696 RepID=A0A7J7DBJ8_TRIWF|nr:uncharacterized protein LOC120004063 [Tripterygium wilfordii]KAF5743664.1 ARM repeat superfamily protein isoform 1 [Tripterygium wilfordii]